MPRHGAGKRQAPLYQSGGSTSLASMRHHGGGKRQAAWHQSGGRSKAQKVRSGGRSVAASAASSSNPEVVDSAACASDGKGRMVTLRARAIRQDTELTLLSPIYMPRAMGRVVNLLASAIRQVVELLLSPSPGGGWLPCVQGPPVRMWSSCITSRFIYIYIYTRFAYAPSGGVFLYASLAS